MDNFYTIYYIPNLEVLTDPYGTEFLSPHGYLLLPTPMITPSFIESVNATVHLIVILARPFFHLTLGHVTGCKIEDIDYMFALTQAHTLLSRYLLCLKPT